MHVVGAKFKRLIPAFEFLQLAVSRDISKSYTRLHQTRCHLKLYGTPAIYLFKPRPHVTNSGFSDFGSDTTMVVKCKSCPFTARLNCLIRKHERAVHLNLKPWPCPFPGCTHRAKRKYDLKRHGRGHEDYLERRCPYICKFEDCGSRLSDKYTLTRHMKTVHQGRDRYKEKTFQCDFCNYKTQEGCLKTCPPNFFMKLIQLVVYPSVIIPAKFWVATPFRFGEI